MSHIQTVRGPIDPSVVTRIMHHEHLLSSTPGPWLSGGRPGARVTTDELDFTASPGDHDLRARPGERRRAGRFRQCVSSESTSSSI